MQRQKVSVKIITCETITCMCHCESEKTRRIDEYLDINNCMK